MSAGDMHRMTDVADLLALTLLEQTVNIRANSHDNFAEAANLDQVSEASALPSNPDNAGLSQRIAKLESRLAIAHDDLAEMALRMGATRGEIVSLQAQLAATRIDRDAWRAQAERLSTPFLLRAWRQRRAG
jgi:uncharacterized coiled-coil protein SlyX